MLSNKHSTWMTSLALTAVWQRKTP